MKNLSKWASTHAISARIIIAVSHVLILFDALFLGFLSYAYDLILPYWFLFILGNVFFIAYFIYPYRGDKKGLFKHSYYKQKVLDFTLVSSAGLALIVGMNLFCNAQDGRVKTDRGEAKLIALKLQSEPPPASDHLMTKITNSVKESRAELRAELKSLKSEFKQQSGEFGLAMLKFFLTIVLIFLFLALLFGVTFLSCSVSCSGNEGLGIVIALLGLVGSIWLLVIAIKAIFRIRRRNRAAPVSLTNKG